MRNSRDGAGRRGLAVRLLLLPKFVASRFSRSKLSPLRMGVEGATNRRICLSAVKAKLLSTPSGTWSVFPTPVLLTSAFSTRFCCNISNYTYNSSCSRFCKISCDQQFVLFHFTISTIVRLRARFIIKKSRYTELNRTIFLAMNE